MHVILRTHFGNRNGKPGWVWWLTPVILALWEAKTGRLLELRGSRPAWSTWQNLISTETTRISQTRWHAPVIPAVGRLRWEDHLSLWGWGCSEPWLCHCTQAWVTEWEPVSKKKEKRKGKKASFLYQRVYRQKLYNRIIVNCSIRKIWGWLAQAATI